MALARAAGAKRALRLNVSGAFHSPLMAQASAGLERALHETPASVPVFPVYSNVTTEPVRDPTAARTLLLRQLTSPVRWTGVVRRLAGDWPGALFVEMGPGTVLTNLVRRIVPDAETAPCGTAAEVTQLLERVA
jgi:[acyl-carrier-protein] S-malonyltransferase